MAALCFPNHFDVLCRRYNVSRMSEVRGLAALAAGWSGVAGMDYVDEPAGCICLQWIESCAAWNQLGGWSNCCMMVQVDLIPSPTSSCDFEYGRRKRWRPRPR